MKPFLYIEFHVCDRRPGEGNPLPAPAIPLPSSCSPRSGRRRLGYGQAKSLPRVPPAPGNGRLPLFLSLSFLLGIPAFRFRHGWGGCAWPPVSPVLAPASPSLCSPVLPPLPLVEPDPASGREQQDPSRSPPPPRGRPRWRGHQATAETPFDFLRVQLSARRPSNSFRAPSP